MRRPLAGRPGWWRIEVLGTCLGADGVVIVWPPGTEVVQQDPLEIEIPDLGRFGLGDSVEVGGGMISEPAPGGPPPSDDGDLVPPGCAEYPVFLAH